MSHWATFKQTATNLWVTLRHDILALAVFLNGLLIFKTIYGMSVNLLDIFHINCIMYSTTENGICQTLIWG